MIGLSLGVYDAKGRFMGSFDGTGVFIQVGSTPIRAYVTKNAIYGDEFGAGIYYESDDCSGPGMFLGNEGDGLLPPVFWVGSRVYERGPTRMAQLRSLYYDSIGCQTIDWLPDEVEAGEAQLLADLSTHFQAPFRLRPVA